MSYNNISDDELYKGISALRRALDRAREAKRPDRVRVMTLAAALSAAERESSERMRMYEE